jgi:hypothetical protein
MIIEKITPELLDGNVELANKWNDPEFVEAFIESILAINPLTQFASIIRSPEGIWLKFATRQFVTEDDVTVPITIPTQVIDGFKTLINNKMMMMMDNTLIQH